MVHERLKAGDDGDKADFVDQATRGYRVDIDAEPRSKRA